MKDPIAVFSAPWLAETFKMHVIVLVRHPAAFAASLKRNRFQHPFDHFLQQPSLMAELGAFAEEIRLFAEVSRPILEQAALLWRIIYDRVYEYQQAYPEWTVVRYEDLCREPIGEFQRLFEATGLQWSETIEGTLLSDVKPNVDAWRSELSGGEIEFLRSTTKKEWSRFYRQEAW